MKLVSFRVEKFRNIIDSGSIDVEPDVTCLVGKNESGKTAVLNALYRLNPAYDEEFVVSEHYPRWLMSADRKAGIVDKVDTVKGSFELEPADVSLVEARFGKGVLKDRHFAYTRGYGSTKATLRIDETVGVRAFLGASTAAASATDLFKNSTSLDAVRDELAARLARLTAAAGNAHEVAELTKLQTELRALIGETNSYWQAVVAVLRERLPKFFYFSQYSVLPGRIDLSAVDEHIGGPGSSGLQTARALLQLAGTARESLLGDDYEERTAELEAVSNDLTTQVFEYWSQNEQLEVEIDVDKETQHTATGQTAVARFLDVRVKDRRHGFTSNFSQRSEGFQWFFSFLAAFSEFDGKNDSVVVLLDEPGLALHAKAQADFLRFIDERLAPSAQVIFTTHSPFMVEPGKLERVRVVEDKGVQEGTVVSSDLLTVSKDSLLPIQAALGYGLATSLFPSPNNLLVEGASHYTYLTVLSDHLRSLGRTSLADTWRVLPTGGAANIPSFVALMGSQLDVTVLVGGGATGLQRVNSLAAQGLLQSQRIITVDQVTGQANAGIEDLFSPGDYLKLYNPAFGSSLTVGGLEPGDRIVDRIGRTQGTNFTDLGKPADYLLRFRDRLLETLTETTLTNFEAAITLVNATHGS